MYEGGYNMETAEPHKFPCVLYCLFALFQIVGRVFTSMLFIALIYGTRKRWCFYAIPP